MASILDLLNDTMGDTGLQEIGKAMGVDSGGARNVVGAALPVLLGAMSKEASKPEGAEALLGALQRDHDGSILDDPVQALRNTADGDGILGHLLGGKRSNVEKGLGQATGLDAGSTGKLLSMLAPVVMGAVGKAQRQGNLDAGGLAGMLNNERDQMAKASPDVMGIVGSMLDSDGDGDFDMGDVVKRGAGLFGKLLGK